MKLDLGELFREFVAALGGGKVRMTQRVTCYAGPWDGKRLTLLPAVTRLPVYAEVPAYASPWGNDDRDPNDLTRLVIEGWYERDGNLLRWRCA